MLHRLQAVTLGLLYRTLSHLSTEATAAANHPQRHALDSSARDWTNGTA